MLLMFKITLEDIVMKSMLCYSVKQPLVLSESWAMCDTDNSRVESNAIFYTFV